MRFQRDIRRSHTRDAPHLVHFPVGSRFRPSHRSSSYNTPHRSPLPPTHVAALACHHNPTHCSPHSTQDHTHSAQALVPHTHSPGRNRVLASPHAPRFARHAFHPGFCWVREGGPANWRDLNQPSSISASSPRISSMDSFSRRTASRSSSWFAVAFTEMSANLLGNRMDVSSQLKAE